MIPSVRAACASTALLAYALPMTVAVASQVGHEVDHFWGELRGVEAEAVDPSDFARADGFVHAHGDVGAHAHAGGLAKLLIAAQQTEEQQNESAVVALELVGHVPAAGVTTLVLVDARAFAVDAPRAALPDASRRPPLPPPRA